MSLIDKLLKNSTIRQTSILNESDVFGKSTFSTTMVPIVNVALSARIDGGVSSGITMLAGPSKHFKTAFALLMAEAFIRAHPKGYILFYDSEFGSPQSYFTSFGIPLDRVIHTPITDIEQLKFDITKQIDGLDRQDEVMIVIDSIGNLASKKEVEDAMSGNSASDMTRAKQLKSTFRIVTPHLTLKDIPMVVVNHTYKEIGMFPKDIVSGGCVGAGTKVVMADGTLKSIEDITVGDAVKTLDGFSTVTATWNPETLVEGTPECFEVEFEDGSKYICSDQHLFMRNGVWVEVTDLLVGDDVAVA